MTRQQPFHALALLAAWAMSAPAAAGNYLAVAIGESTVKDWSDDALAFDGSGITNATFEDTDSAIRVALGFAASESLTLELAYVDLGEATANGTSDGAGTVWASGPVYRAAAIEGYDFGFVGRIPMSENFALLARIGIFMWEQKSVREDSGSSLSGTRNGDDPFFGAGAEFNVSQSVALRGEFTRYSADDLDADALSLSAILRFGD
jgi:OOP family OmpA-OmpF porin